jgi:hypothetical protein
MARKLGHRDRDSSKDYEAAGPSVAHTRK